MEFTLRDVIYLSVYVATIAGLFTKFKGSLNQLSQSVESIKNILFLEKGGLNIVDNSKCKEHQDTVFRTIRRESEITADALDQIYCLNQNIIKIMSHMNLEPTAVQPKSRRKGSTWNPPNKEL